MFMRNLVAQVNLLNIVEVIYSHAYVVDELLVVLHMFFLFKKAFVFLDVVAHAYFDIDTLIISLELQHDLLVQDFKDFEEEQQVCKYYDPQRTKRCRLSR
jgi:hypothetical protein